MALRASQLAEHAAPPAAAAVVLPAPPARAQGDAPGAPVGAAQAALALAVKRGKPRKQGNPKKLPRGGRRGKLRVSTDPKKLERPMPRKQRFAEAEDELMLRAWLRWHAQHGFERECFTLGRDWLPQLNLREVQVRACGRA